MMSLAVCTGRLPWLGLLTLLPLLRAIQVLRPMTALNCGAFWGAALFTFSVVPGEPTIAPTLSSFILLTTIPAAYAALGAHVTRLIGFSPLVLGVGWMLVQLALHPLALRYGLPAETQSGGILLEVIGRVFGYVLVAFVVAFASAWLLAIAANLHVTLSRPLRPLGLDDLGRCLWHRIPARNPRHLPCPAQPRAPPVRCV